MNSIFYITIVLFAVSCQKGLATPISDVKKMHTPDSSFIKTTSRDLADCMPNICFAIDGSGSIPNREFLLALDFTSDLTSEFEESQGRYALVQYSQEANVSIPLTQDMNMFISMTGKETQAKGGPTNIERGVRRCIEELSVVEGENKNIVLFGDGRDNDGGMPLTLIDKFRSAGGRVFSVASGFAKNQLIFEFAGNSTENVFEVNSRADILPLSDRICDL